MLPGSPISASGAPAGDTCSLSDEELQDTPSVGAVTVTQPASRAGLRHARDPARSAAPRPPSSSLRRSVRLASAWLSSRLGRRQRRLPPPRAPLRDPVDGDQLLARDRGWSGQARAAARHSTAARRRAPTPARAASTAASSSRRVRRSRKGGSAGLISGDRRLRRARPGRRSSIGSRWTRPATGVETRKMSRMRGDALLVDRDLERSAVDRRDVDADRLRHHRIDAGRRRRPPRRAGRHRV